MKHLRPASSLLLAALALTFVFVSETFGETGGSPSRFEGGVRYVDGKPYFSRAAFFGYNHWMTENEANSLGNFMRIPFEQVGSKKDFYSSAGFNSGYYSIWGHTWLNGKAYDPTLTRECFRRAAKANQKVVIALPVLTPQSVEEKYDFHWVTEDGKKVPFGHTWGMYHDPEKQAMAIRDTYKQVIDVVRTEPLNIGYQLGCERWAYDYVRVKKDVSFDEWTLAQFRKFLEKRFTLEQIGERYGHDKRFFKSWEEVCPPVSKKPEAFGGRKLANWDAARWDWYCYREKATANVWVRMIEEFQNMDGTGRPISFEHNHGPYYSMGFHPFPEICARTKNFSVGNGDFSGDLNGTVASMIQAKGCGEGPWINNELDAGTTNRHMDSAIQRRKIWGTIAMGAGGFHLWTFFNLMGASSEFTNDTYFNPVLYDNMPPKFFEVLHADRMIESLGGTLAGSKSPAPRIALMLIDDSIFLNTFTLDYKPEGENFCRSISTRGFADAVVMDTKWHLDETSLDGIEVIVLPRMPRIVDSRARKLADFVKKGGTLVLMGPTGRYNELFEQQKSFPYGELGTAAGIRMNALSTEQVRSAPLAFDWNKKSVHFDVQVELEIPQGSKAEPLLASGGKIYATKNSYGKGVVYTLPGFPIVTAESDPTGEFIAGLLRDAGLQPGVTLRSGKEQDTGIMAAHRKGPDGTLVFLIENENKAHHVEVEFNPRVLGLDQSKAYSVFECFSDEMHKVSGQAGFRFETELEPVGIRIYLITEAASLDAVIPKSHRYMVPKNPDAILVPKASRGLPYLTGTPLSEAMAWQRRNTVSMSDGKEPSGLGNGFKALDISKVENAPLSRMIKGVGEEQFVNFGNTESGKDSGAVLGFSRGITKIGDVPFFSDGRYFAMETTSQVTGIPVGGKFLSLHFFHGTQHGQGHSTLGYYRVNYLDGTAVQIPIVLGVTLTDFTRGVKFAPKTTAFTAINDCEKHNIDLRRFDWTNPHPEKQIASLDIVANPSGDERTVNIWAISGKTLN